jgi:metal-responsive CopG/Arc/MetJ family transcriptional regulator
MTTQMVRKQIYIPKRLDETLKRLSQKRGVSEAEIIRQALEHEGTGKSNLPRNSQAALQEILHFSDERLALRDAGQPYTWNRDEIYEEREKRWDRKKTGK